MLPFRSLLRASLLVLVVMGFQLGGDGKASSRHREVRIDARMPQAAGFVSVSEFGAVGDGRADDTAAFQAAIRHLSEGKLGGGTLLVPKGDYRITATLDLRSGINLRGASRRATRIIAYMRNGEDALRLALPVLDKFGSSHFGVGISDLSIIGYGTDGSGRSTGNGLYIADTNKCTVERVDIVNFPNGAGLVVRSGAFQSEYSNIDIVNCKVGIDVNGGEGKPNRVTTIRFNDCQATRCSLRALNVYACYDVYFNGCTFQDTGAIKSPGGDAVGALVQNSAHIVFNQCHFERTAAENLVVLNSLHVVVTDSSLTSAGYRYGVFGSEDERFAALRFGSGAMNCAALNNVYAIKAGPHIILNRGASHNRIIGGTAYDAAYQPRALTIRDNGKATILDEGLANGDQHSKS